MWAAPNSPVARTTDKAPAGWKLSSDPTGASTTGSRSLRPKSAHRDIDLADVAQHPRPERESVERHAVAPQRCFGFGAADDVVPIVLVQVLPRLGDDLMQIEKVGRKRLDVVSRGFLGMPLLHECLLRVEGA